MKAIIFDLDGVLADTPYIVSRTDRAVFKSLGLNYDAQTYKKSYGSLTHEELIKKTGEEYFNITGNPMPKNTRDRLVEECTKGFKKELTTCIGVTEILPTLQYPMAVASNSDQEHMHRKLNICGIEHHFTPHIYSSELVEKGKPAPDIYLYAANQLGTLPTECIAVEDSPSGIKAAVAAGIQVLGFIGGKHCDEKDAEKLKQAGAYNIIQDMRELTTYL